MSMTAEYHKIQRRLSVLLSCAVIALMLSSCQFEDVTLKEVEDFKIENISPKGMEGTIFLVLENPNLFSITVKSADFEIYNGSVRLGEAQLKDSFKIKGNSTETYPVRLSGNLSNLLAGGLTGIAGLLSGKKPADHHQG